MAKRLRLPGACLDALVIPLCALLVATHVPSCPRTTGAPRNLSREGEPSGSWVGQGVSQPVHSGKGGHLSEGLCPQQKVLSGLGEPSGRVQQGPSQGRQALPSDWQKHYMKSLEKEAEEETPSSSLRSPAGGTGTLSPPMPACAHLWQQVGPRANPSFLGLILAGGF